MTRTRAVEDVFAARLFGQATVDEPLRPATVWPFNTTGLERSDESDTHKA